MSRWGTQRVWLALLLLWPSHAKALKAGPIYHTPPSPFLQRHSLTFKVPAGWQLTEVFGEDEKYNLHALHISSTGQIQDWPYWDTHGLTVELQQRHKPKITCELTLYVFSNWYAANGLYLHQVHRFQTSSGLKGVRAFLWQEASPSNLHTLFLLHVPFYKGLVFHADRTYGAEIGLDVEFSASQRSLILPMVDAFARSLAITTYGVPSQNWPKLPSFVKGVQGTFYTTPPSEEVGRQVRFIIPIGWSVRITHEVGSGWGRWGPELQLLRRSKEGHSAMVSIALSFETAAYEAHEMMQGMELAPWGYPCRLSAGLEGLIIPGNSRTYLYLYIPQTRLSLNDRSALQGMYLCIACISQNVKDMFSLIQALFSSIQVLAPSRELSHEVTSFDPHFEPMHGNFLGTNPLQFTSYGTLVSSACCGGTDHTGFLFSLSPDGTGFHILHSFAPLQPDFSNQDGAFPFTPLAQDAHQNLYGTTSTGGPACDGTLFTLAPDGSHFHLLHAFSGPDGALPYAGVLPSKDGWLYGVTEEGGLYGKGVVYRIREDGTGFQVLHSFGGRDGAYPLLVELVEGSGGWLYGVTSGGGVYGNGVVFGVKEDGSGYRVLHEFSAEDGLGRNGDGSHPYGGLVLGLGGWLYGETYGGGGYGMGVVFRVREDGSGYRVLHTFKGGVEGSHALGRLLLWGKKLYGVCSEGGSLGGGCVFVLGVGGEGYRVLHSFGVDREGWPGLGGLVLLGSEWLYGVTESGGVGGEGVVYRLRADGSGFRVVYDFGKRLRKVSER